MSLRPLMPYRLYQKNFLMLISFFYPCVLFLLRFLFNWAETAIFYIQFHFVCGRTRGRVAGWWLWCACQVPEQSFYCFKLLECGRASTQATSNSARQKISHKCQKKQKVRLKEIKSVFVAYLSVRYRCWLIWEVHETNSWSLKELFFLRFLVGNFQPCN